jgi:hypothetical protein
MIYSKAKLILGESQEEDFIEEYMMFEGKTIVKKNKLTNEYNHLGNIFKEFIEKYLQRYKNAKFETAVWKFTVDLWNRMNNKQSAQVPNPVAPSSNEPQEQIAKNIKTAEELKAAVKKQNGV